MSVQRKKQYEIIKTSKRSEPVKGLFVGKEGKQLKFGDSGAMVVHDPGVAKEIRQKYGQDGSKDVTVIEVDDMDRDAENRGGKRTRKSWAVPALPWKDND